MNMPERKERPYVLPLLLLLVITLALVLLVMQNRALQAVREELEGEELARDEAAGRLTRLQGYQRQAGAYRERLDFVAGQIPDTPGEAGLMAYLEGLAEKCGLESFNLSLGSHVPGEDFVTLPLTLTFEARYTDLHCFLSRLRRGEERALRIDALRVQSGGEGGDTLSVTMQVAAFYREGS